MRTDLGVRGGSHFPVDTESVSSSSTQGKENVLVLTSVGGDVSTVG